MDLLDTSLLASVGVLSVFLFTFSIHIHPLASLFTIHVDSRMINCSGDWLLLHNVIFKLLNVLFHLLLFPVFLMLLFSQFTEQFAEGGRVMYGDACTVSAHRGCRFFIKIYLRFFKKELTLLFSKAKMHSFDQK